MNEQLPDATVARIIVIMFTRGLVVLVAALAPAIALLNRGIVAGHWGFVVPLVVAGWILLVVLACQPLVQEVRSCPQPMPRPKR